MRRALGLLAVLYLLLLPGCSGDLLWAVGPTETVGVITSFSLQDRRLQVLSASLEAPVQMVRPENRFRIEPIPADLFRANRDLKALALLTDLSAPGVLAEAVDVLISRSERMSMATQDVDYRLIENVWAKGQCVLLVHARSGPALEEFLRTRGTHLARNFDDALQAAIAPAVLAGGEDDAMESYLRSQYGFEIGIPRGYVTGEDAVGRVVRLHRALTGEPARYLMVHWMPIAERPRDFGELLALRDRLGREYGQGDEVLRERSEVREGTFQGEPAWVVEGVWQNHRFVMGGPFRTYGFARDDRYFLVDAAVFNPPGKKLPYLREVLALARTFRTVEPS